jgi:aspartate/methionine/tyrosine aminotransferase
MPPAALEHIAAVARRRDIWVLSDEIYARLVYESPAPSIAALPGMAERTIICDGFSKTYAMTGWRLGFGIMPAALAAKIDLLLTHSVGCTATFTHWRIGGGAWATGPRRRCGGRVPAAADLTPAECHPGIRCPMPRGVVMLFPT